MTPRHFIMTVGIIALVVGLYALITPVGVDGFDRCGDAFRGTSSDAARKDRTSELAGALSGSGFRTEYAEQCEDAIGSRQAWSWPVTIAGLLAAVGAAVIRTNPTRVAVGGATSSSGEPPVAPSA